MTKRYRLITSDEYATTYVECIIRSGRLVGDMRAEMSSFILRLRDELMHETAALREQLEDQAKIIKELKQKTNI